jgi:D-glycero-alpha-D-manno-heptose-7-phosphate kinase
MRNQVIRARAPLRIGLGGGGTDVAPYSETFGGVVLNATIDLYAHVTIELRDDGLVEFRAPDRGAMWIGPAALPLQFDADSDLKLVRGVYNRMCADFNEGKPIAATIITYADAPAGSGLGTSSAVVIALVEAFRFLLQQPLGVYEVAHLAYEIERIDLQLSGGKQDQYAAAFGGVNFIEFGPGDAVLVNPLRIPLATLAEFESSLVLFFTGVSRDSANIIDQQSANVLKGQKASIDAMHALKADAFLMKNALLRGQVSELAALLDHSWAKKKETAANIANARIDGIYRAAKESGAIGGKVSGAGGGGFMMFLAEPRDKPRLMAMLREHEGQIFSSRLTLDGAFAWKVPNGRG